MDGRVPHTAVTGLQWGDEGKGKIVDLLSEDFDVVARYNGGANAGHSVVIGETRYALHLVPCGILRSDTINVIGNGVVLDPEVLATEIAGLEEAGVRVGDNLRISDRAHLVMPYHKQADGLMEAALSAAAGEQAMIGTTGRGIGPCYADKATRGTAVRVCDLGHAAALRERLRHIAAVKNASLGALAEMAGLRWEPVDAESLMAQASGWAERLRPHVADTASLIRERMAAGDRVLFEGGNGSLLDVDHGSYPYVTSSHTTALGVHAGAGVPAAQLGRIVGIVKAYSTRVGGGPMPTELQDDVAEHLRVRGREFGTTTGRPRRCGWLDLVALRHTAQLSGATEIALMLVDVLAGLEELKVCLRYRIGGRDVSDFPASAVDLAAAEPVLESMPGFKEEVTALERFEDLPGAAKDYVACVEEAVGVPVSIVSVGPGRRQTLRRA